MVRVYADKDRTITEHSIKPPDYLKTSERQPKACLDVSADAHGLRQLTTKKFA
jgi:hypothetical protein